MSIAQSILYIALTTSSPVDGHCGAEVVAKSYARVPVSVESWRYDKDGFLVNGVTIRFPDPKQKWGMVEGFCLIDERGTVIVTGALTSDRDVDAGDDGPSFQRGSIVFRGVALGKIEQFIEGASW